VHVIEYTLPGLPDAEPRYRLVTTLLDPTAAPAAELAAPYHEQRDIETAFDELKTHLRGARIVLRSKTPELVRQEAYGLLAGALRRAGPHARGRARCHAARAGSRHDLLRPGGARPSPHAPPVAASPT